MFISKTLLSFEARQCPTKWGAQIILEGDKSKLKVSNDNSSPVNKHYYYYS